MHVRLVRTPSPAALVVNDNVPQGIKIEPLEEGGYGASSPDLPGLVTWADTLKELEENIGDAVKVMIDTSRKEGVSLPAALSPIKSKEECKIPISIGVPAAA